MNKRQETKTKARKFVTAIDQAELTVRLLEIGIKMQRPPGVTGAVALADIRKNSRSGSIEASILDDFEQMAVAAIEYFGQCIDALQSVN